MLVYPKDKFRVWKGIDFIYERSSINTVFQNEISRKEQKRIPSFDQIPLRQIVSAANQVWTNHSRRLGRPREEQNWEVGGQEKCGVRRIWHEGVPMPICLIRQEALCLQRHVLLPHAQPKSYLSDEGINTEDPN